jgi:hypothetical protein
MEQHIRNLVEEVVKKQTSNNTKRPKNSPGSKKPRPSLPKKNKQGERHQTPAKQKHKQETGNTRNQRAY